MAEMKEFARGGWGAPFTAFHESSERETLILSIAELSPDDTASIPQGFTAEWQQGTTLVLKRARALFYGLCRHAGLELIEEEILDGVRNIRPELLAIRLANSPLRVFVDRPFEVDEIAPKIYVLPFWIGTDRARAPELETAILKKAETVAASESSARTHGIPVAGYSVFGLQ